MSITVVTTRDYDGAPTTRDVYADAERYRIGDSNLEIYSAQSQLLAFYGSGNWQSVFVDDPVQVHTGPPDPSVYDGMPLTSDLVPAGPTRGRAPAAGRAPTEGRAPTDGRARTDGRGLAPAPAADVPRAPVTIQRPRPEPRPAATGAEPTPVRPAAASAEMLARSPSMRRVRFAPRIYRAARNGATPSAPDTSWSAPTSMRPVVFRPKVYRAAREAAQAEAAQAEAAQAEGDASD